MSKERVFPKFAENPDLKAKYIFLRTEMGLTPNAAMTMMGLDNFLDTSKEFPQLREKLSGELKETSRGLFDGTEGREGFNKVYKK